MQENYEISKDLIQNFTSFTVCSGDIKKVQKMNKKSSSENDQSTEKKIM